MVSSDLFSVSTISTTKKHLFYLCSKMYFFQEVFLTFMNHAEIVHTAFNGKVAHDCSISFNTSARGIVRTLTTSKIESFAAIVNG